MIGSTDIIPADLRRYYRPAQALGVYHVQSSENAERGSQRSAAHIRAELGKHQSDADPRSLPRSDEHPARLNRTDHPVEAQGRHRCRDGSHFRRVCVRRHSDREPEQAGCVLIWHDHIHLLHQLLRQRNAQHSQYLRGSWRISRRILMCSSTIRTLRSSARHRLP